MSASSAANPSVCNGSIPVAASSVQSVAQLLSGSAGVLVGAADGDVVGSGVVVGVAVGSTGGEDVGGVVVVQTGAWPPSPK